jgi:hypothetical protein
MSREVITAARVLADTLAAENAALAALDLPRVAAMLADKQRAAAAFVAAQDAPVVAAHREAAQNLADRLRSLAAENRMLLERAIVVQSRVMGVIARAAATVVAPSSYGARGRCCDVGRPAAYALSARA